MARAASFSRQVARRVFRAVPLALSAYNILRAERDARRFLATMPGARPTLVYQMGKVGSSTVARTLETLPQIPRPVAHVHFLEPSYVAQVRSQAVRDVGWARVGYTWALGRALGSHFARLGDALDVDAITLVRDPVARAVSAVFQSPALARVNGTDLLSSGGGLDVKRTLAWVVESIATLGSADYPERWLRSEIEPVLGVDLFAHAFDFERGYRVIEGPKGRVLVLRMEDLDRRLGSALQGFYGLEEAPPIVRSNIRREESGREDYGEVLEALQLPSPLVNRIYADRFARHFYTPEELAGFTRCWCSPHHPAG